MNERRMHSDLALRQARALLFEALHGLQERHLLVPALDKGLCELLVLLPQFFASRLVLCKLGSTRMWYNQY